MNFIHLMLWGTGGPLMYAALGLALITAVFYKMAKDWAANLTEVPLNYISEPRYRTPSPAPVYSGPITAMSAYALTATYALTAMPMFNPGHVWAVQDPRDIAILDRLPGVPQ